MNTSVETGIYLMYLRSLEVPRVKVMEIISKEEPEKALAPMALKAPLMILKNQCLYIYGFLTTSDDH